MSCKCNSSMGAARPRKYQAYSFASYGADAPMIVPGDMAVPQDGDAYLCDGSDELVHSPLVRTMATAAIFWGTMRILDGLFGGRV